MAEEDPGADQGATIRINGTMFKDYIGAIARVVGRIGPAVENADAPAFSLTTSDNTVVTVIRSSDMALPDCEIIEVIGTIQDDHTINEVLIVSFDKNFGLSFLAVFSFHISLIL